MAQKQARGRTGVLLSISRTSQWPSGLSAWEEGEHPGLHASVWRQLPFSCLRRNVWPCVPAKEGRQEPADLI